MEQMDHKEGQDVAKIKLSEITKMDQIEGLFPRPANYDEIKADIEARGIQEALVINTENKLLCGYTRLAIAADLGLEDIPRRVVDITDPEAMIEYAILDNIRRRQLSILQLVEYGLILERLYGDRQGQRSDLGTDCPEVKSGRTRDIVAAELSEVIRAKMSGRTYSRLRTIAMKASPEVKAAFNEGEISQAEALSLCRFNHITQARMVDEDDLLTLIKISEVSIPDWYPRKDLGDLEGLAKSIEEIGLLHAVAVNNRNVLIFGLRRLEAHKLLGWKVIEAYRYDVDDYGQMLRMLNAENAQREGYRPSELVAVARTLIEEEVVD